jgi:hypothetical protein
MLRRCSQMCQAACKTGLFGFFDLLCHEPKNPDHYRKTMRCVPPNKLAASVTKLNSHWRTLDFVLQGGVVAVRREQASREGQA